MSNVELCVDCRSQLGEGPVWDAGSGVLYWLDIEAGLIHYHNTATRTHNSVCAGLPVGALCLRKSGGLLLATGDGFAEFDIAGGELKKIAAPEVERELESKDKRFNDGKCDPAGRFWAGTLDRASAQGGCALYRLDTDYSVRKILPDVRLANGLAWSADRRTLYFIDTPARSIFAFDYDDASGEIGNRRVAVEVPEGMGLPDGMAIDTEGRLWVGHWGGGAVCCWNPQSGELMAQLAVPASHVSSCAFGGPALDRLFITTARQGLSQSQLAREPHAGSLFTAQMDVRGAAVPRFGR